MNQDQNSAEIRIAEMVADVRAAWIKRQNQAFVRLMDAGEGAGDPMIDGVPNRIPPLPEGL